MKTCKIVFAAVCLMALGSVTESIICSSGTYTMVNIFGFVSENDTRSDITCPNGNYSCFRLEVDWTLSSASSSQILTQCQETSLCSSFTCNQFSSILQQTGATVSRCVFNCCMTDNCNLTPLTITGGQTAGAKHYEGQAMLLSILAFSSMISVQF